MWKGLRSPFDLLRDLRWGTVGTRLLPRGLRGTSHGAVFSLQDPQSLLLDRSRLVWSWYLWPRKLPWRLCECCGVCGMGVGQYERIVQQMVLLYKKTYQQFCVDCS